VPATAREAGAAIASAAHEFIRHGMVIRFDFLALDPRVDKILQKLLAKSKARH
jgi:hypothetical protein